MWLTEKNVKTRQGTQIPEAQSFQEEIKEQDAWLQQSREFAIAEST